MCPAGRRPATALLALAAGVRLDEVLARCRRVLLEALSAFEVMWPDYVEGALRAGDCRVLPESFRGHRVILLEVDGVDDAYLAARLERLLEQLLEQRFVEDAVLPQSMADAAALWGVREAVGEIQASIRPYVGFDLGLPASRHDEVVGQARCALQTTFPQLRSFFFGHAGDGNLHALVGPCPDALERQAVEAILYEQMEPLHSSVTAEHGVGRKRLAHLYRSRSQGDIFIMRRLKAALDPGDILNPGRVIPPAR